MVVIAGLLVVMSSIFGSTAEVPRQQAEAPATIAQCNAWASNFNATNPDGAVAAVHGGTRCQKIEFQFAPSDSSLMYTYTMLGQVDPLEASLQAQLAAISEACSESGWWGPDEGLYSVSVLSPKQGEYSDAETIEDLDLVAVLRVPVEYAGADWLQPGSPLAHFSSANAFMAMTAADCSP